MLSNSSQVRSWRVAELTPLGKQTDMTATAVKEALLVQVGGLSKAGEQDGHSSLPCGRRFSELRCRPSQENSRPRPALCYGLPSVSPALQLFTWGRPLVRKPRCCGAGIPRLLPAAVSRQNLGTEVEARRSGREESSDV